MATLTSSHDRLENHIRLALTDVKQMQSDLTSFKERIETFVKDETSDNQYKWSYVKLNVKQVNDIVRDLQV